MDDQDTKWHRNIAKNFNWLSTMHERYRQTDDSQTDLRWHIANMNVKRSLKIWRPTHYLWNGWRYYHTRALRHVRTVLTDDLAQTVACSIVGSRLDYCNAMLYGASAATLDVLQRAQNNLARVVCQREGRPNARPLLRSLHWLPVKRRVTYKIAALTFKTEHLYFFCQVLDTVKPMIFGCH